MSKLKHSCAMRWGDKVKNRQCHHHHHTHHHHQSSSNTLINIPPQTSCFINTVFLTVFAATKHCVCAPAMHITITSHHITITSHHITSHDVTKLGSKSLHHLPPNPVSSTRTQASQRRDSASALAKERWIYQKENAERLAMCTKNI